MLRYVHSMQIVYHADHHITNNAMCCIRIARSHAISKVVNLEVRIKGHVMQSDAMMEHPRKIFLCHEFSERLTASIKFQQSFFLFDL